MHRALEPDRDDLGLSLPRLAFQCARESAERPFRCRPGADRAEWRIVIFEFVVRRLKWLAAIPGVPQIFDAMLFGVDRAFLSRPIACD